MWPGVLQIRPQEGWICWSALKFLLIHRLKLSSDSSDLSKYKTKKVSRPAHQVLNKHTSRHAPKLKLVKFPPHILKGSVCSSSSLNLQDVYTETNTGTEAADGAAPFLFNRVFIFLLSALLSPTGMHILLDLNPKLHFHQRFYAFICLYFRSIPTSSLNYLLSLKTLGFALRFLFALLCFSLSFCLIKFCCYRYMCICQLLCCCWVKLVAKSVVHQPQQELARKHFPADSQWISFEKRSFYFEGDSFHFQLASGFFSLINIVHVVGVTGISL